MPKLITVLLLALACSIHCHGGIITVRSNADAGPGTLREAITLANANGILETDSILFNLPDLTATGRRIVLRSALPALTSNMMIDASTQPGSKWGLSDARVELYAEFDAGITQKIFNIIKCSGIRIYALKIDNHITWTAMYPDNFCFYIQQSENVEIGNVGKGNVIINWTYAIRGVSEPGATNRNINIFSNFLGLNEDGETPEYNEELIAIYNIENINIGSLDPRQGNVMACSRRRVELSGTRGKILIANNKIGSNYSGTVALSMPYGESSHYFDNIFIINSIWANEIEYLTDISLINNLSTGICRSGIYILGYGKKFFIQGNKIGTDITGTKRLSEKMDYGVRIENSRSGVIGVVNDEVREKNIIAFAEQGSSAETYLAGTGVALINCASGITVSRNSIFCDQKWGIGIGSGGAYYTPVVTINSITASTIGGTAPPLAKIELFHDDSCVNCEGKVYFDSTYADAAGYWNKTNINTADVVVTATDTSHMTSEFSAAKYILSNFEIKNATCGRSNGSIKGVQIISGTWWRWEDQDGKIAGTDSVLTNAGPGNYRLMIGIGSNTCSVTTSWYEIRNVDPPVSLAPAINAASCGRNNGSIFADFNTNDLAGKWLNAIGDSSGSGGFLDNALPGNYFLELSVLADTSCKKRYGPFMVPNQSGPSLIISAAVVQPATCGKNNGSISGITLSNVTGTPVTEWLDSLNRTVGTGLDLLNITAGKFRLKFKDASACDTILTNFFIVASNGEISIDTTGMQVTASGCRSSTGTIRQVTVTGGEQYQWVAAPANGPIGTTLDVSSLAPGNYQLMVNNHFGCSEVSPVIPVPASSFAPIGVTGVETNNALCSTNSGRVRITSFSGDSALYSFRWTDSSNGQTVRSGTSLANLAAGTYRLYALDRNGCEKNIFDARITAFAPPVIDDAQVDVKDDLCNQKLGSLTRLEVSGLQGPTSYEWFDAQGLPAGNSIDLLNAGSGSYSLKITDGGVCMVESKLFTLVNNDQGLAAPLYENLVVPRNTGTLFTLKNPANGAYLLFADPAGSVLLQQNTTGNFNIPSVPTDTAFYVRRSAGTCSSPLTQVRIKVVDKSFFALAKAFTPNNDGLNDAISVKVIGFIELNYCRIYNRYGELVFQTKLLNDRWDGRYKGILQPTGAYMWIAEGKELNGKPVMEKGSILLIR